MKNEKTIEHVACLRHLDVNKKLIEAVNHCLPILNKRFDYEVKCHMDAELGIRYLTAKKEQGLVNIPDFSTQLHPAFCWYLGRKESRLKLARFYLDVVSDLNPESLDKAELIALSKFLEAENLNIQEGKTFPKKEQCKYSEYRRKEYKLRDFKGRESLSSEPYSLYDFCLDGIYDNIIFEFLIKKDDCFNSVSIDDAELPEKINQNIQSDIYQEEPYKTTPEIVIHEKERVGLPDTGLYYIPLRCEFNESQRLEAFGLFNGFENKLLDIHFYLEGIGVFLCSISDSASLEELGFIVDPNNFKATILLSEGVKVPNVSTSLLQSIGISENVSGSILKFMNEEE